MSCLSRLNNVFLMDSDLAYSSVFLARAMSRSVTGLFSIFSSLNLFKADTGGQLRMVTISSLRSSVPNQVRARHNEQSRTYDSFHHEPNTFYSVLCAVADTFNDRYSTIAMKRAHFSGYFVDNPARNCHGSGFVHATCFGDYASECHGWHRRQ